MRSIPRPVAGRACSLHHRWNLTPRAAVALQTRLRSSAVLADRLGDIRLVAGTDVGFEDGGAVTRAAVALLSFPELELVEHALARRLTRFPYVPGLLSFREAPAILAALRRLRRRPDLILCDGQGVAHPRRFGLASHLGLLANIPTIGVAKTRLIGIYDDPLDTPGAWCPLRDGEEVIGAVLRTRLGVKPVFVSPGHLISLETAIRYVLACTRGYRLPETTRWAHRLASGGDAAFDKGSSTVQNRATYTARSPK